jgi:hypothetical protein
MLTYRIILLILLCTQTIVAQIQNADDEFKFPLLDSSALKTSSQTIVLYQTDKYIVFTTENIFYPAFQRLFDKHRENDYYVAIRDSLKKDTLIKIIYLDNIIYSISKNKVFFMSELMQGNTLIYNKSSKKLEDYITCKQWHFTNPYNGYARSYRIGKTEIYKERRLGTSNKIG